MQVLENCLDRAVDVLFEGFERVVFVSSTSTVITATSVGVEGDGEGKGRGDRRYDGEAVREGVQGRVGEGGDAQRIRLASLLLSLT